MISDLLKQRKEIRDNIEIIFVGPCEKFSDGKNIEDYISEYKLTDIVKLTGPVSRKKSIEFQMQASLLLLIVGVVAEGKEHMYGIPGKIFDYMATGKPILTLADDGATRQFIKENQIGSVFYHKDANLIKEFILDTIINTKVVISDNVVNSKLNPRFDFRLLTSQLINDLNTVIKEKG